MILDKKLKLVNNQDIGAKSFYSSFVSPDKFSISKLGSIGKGEQVYCCVTIRTEFTVTGGSTSLFAFYLLSEGYFTKESADTGSDIQKYVNTFTIQPTAGYSGYISAFDASNCAAGKKYIFPVNPFTVLQKTLSTTHKSDGHLYFAFDEVSSSDGLPVAEATITAGNIDVELVTLAEPGAGSGFCDLMYYPTSIKVQ